MFPNYTNQREDNVSSPKVGRKWQTEVIIALYKKWSTPAVLLSDFHRDWPLPPGQEHKKLVLWERRLLLQGDAHT